ncbi:uncharacterized protein MCYG_06065 [Microsporum canis CBS 113480]|uniref:Uncharacterized protein n=1 Tax=Arthroderma otae (strain ATCC MYA-4605 / CBS 113480) TaxID=554155 RepID=C5FTP3_ARTOC|nr:uncharacterized protein MCYG_06065 [Microsporum canis CBS 113480]EEQ33246.1 predicted protein [Microsporum canis CBS 113480]
MKGWLFNGGVRKGLSRRAPEWLLGDRWSFGWAGGAGGRREATKGDFQARRSTKPFTRSPAAVPSVSIVGGRRVVMLDYRSKGRGKNDMRLVGEVRFFAGES